MKKRHKYEDFVRINAESDQVFQIEACRAEIKVIKKHGNLIFTGRGNH